jgi:hypothetical protein
VIVGTDCVLRIVLKVERGWKKFVNQTTWWSSPIGPPVNFRRYFGTNWCRFCYNIWNESEYRMDEDDIWLVSHKNFGWVTTFSSPT